MVVEVPISTLHKQIHANLSGIPTIRQSSARMALEELNRLQEFGGLRMDEPLSRRIELLIFMLDGIEPAAVRALKKQLKIVAIYEERQKLSKMP